MDVRATHDAATKGVAPIEAHQEATTSRVGGFILFAEDSAELNDDAKSRLKDLAPVLLGKPNKIEIRGHATGRPLPADSSYSDAWQLSYARSMAVYDFLKNEGVEPRRMRLSQGGPHEPEEQPGHADWAKVNSRVEVYMLSEFMHEPKKPRQPDPAPASSDSAD